MVSTTPWNYHGLNYQKGKFNGNHKKREDPGKIRKRIESLLLKTRSLKIKTRSLELKTQSLVQKMIKIQIIEGKGILREYSLKDRSLPSKDRVLTFCNDFFKNFGLLTSQTYNKT